MIRGTGFLKHVRTRVFFGDVEASLEVSPDVQGSSTIVAVSPKGAAGFVDVRVEGPDGQTATMKTAFRYEAVEAPVITTVTPKNGPATGGTRMTILGKGFTAGCRIHVGGRGVTTARIKDSSTLRIVTPAMAAGLADVQVVNPDGQTATAKGAFQVDAVPDPVLESLAPKYGSAKGGTSVTLFGKHFVSGMKVQFGDTLVEKVKLVDAGTLEFTAPAAYPAWSTWA